MTERPKREGVMLAYPGDPGRISRLGDAIFAQPKLKGERCRVEWFKDKPYLISSYGNEFNCLPHINKQIEVTPELHRVPTDGELYVHGLPFDGEGGIHSICSRRTNPHPDYQTMQYHIFDIQWEEQSQWFRIHKLQHWWKGGKPTGPLHFVETVVTTPHAWLDLMNIWVGDGYEGIILRNPIAYYRPKRDVGLIKVKPTETDEYQIIEVTEAIDKNGIPKAMVGAFLVQDQEGLQFYVGAGKLTHNKRTKYWQERFELPGRMLVTKHEPEVTKGGVPVCAVAVKIK